MTVGCRNPCDDIERLKVCGTCATFSITHDESGECAQSCSAECHDEADWTCGEYECEPDMHDPCHFTPSKWRPYWEE